MKSNFFWNPKRNWERIDRVYNSNYVALCVYADIWVKEEDESRRAEESERRVRAARAEAYAETRKFKDDDDVLKYLFEKIDRATTDFTQQQQLEKASDLLYGKNRGNRIITVEVLKAFMEEKEKLPSKRRSVFSLFFSGLTSSEVAEKTGRKVRTVINQKNEAIKDIRKALISRGYLSMGGG